MALAVSFTNSGMQLEACDALRRWICHNLRYKHLLQVGRRSQRRFAPSRYSSISASSLGGSAVCTIYANVSVCVFLTNTQARAQL